ncbi:zinc metalloproteinase nas-13-like [Maniola jurtina]|uniref:zinc metalloproteinase nas-13-like n=1 Tax=Maniola jurtina TaxID=191418 RepID=UPI001E68A9AD|nr:zinc metalloproteinase nas-13-like [Maniola jurtina]
MACVQDLTSQYIFTGNNMPGPSVFLVMIWAYLANAASISKELESPIYNNSKAEQGTYFEGDMILTTDQMDAIMFGSIRRNGIRDVTFRWPNATVVYHITEDHFNEKQVKMIEEAMNEISSISCVKFRPQQNNEHAVIIQRVRSGCSSCVGYRVKPVEGCTKQTLNLGNNCFQHGIIMHELLHTIGFYHMQNSYDRDDYVKIFLENVEKNQEHNFLKYPKEIVTTFGVPYDYNSIMHYGEYYFSKNGKRTIIPLQENVTIGQRIHLSKGDIIKLNRMYNCVWYL